MTALHEPFDPESFRELAHRVVDVLADHLQRSQGGELPVLPVVRPEEMLRRWPGGFAGPAVDLVALLERALADSNHLHHPRYVGHQVATTLPAAAMVEMVNGMLNNGMAVYEMGQVHTIAERRVVEFLGRAVGFGVGSDGVLTHGGSLGNLTALLAARQATAGYDVWREGQRRPMAVLVSEQAHYCVGRAVQAMGWGAAGIQSVATDARCRMDMGDLPRALERANAAGRQVVAVVASACTTATGSFDPLAALADFCEREGLWLHVDGAHGASMVLSDRHRHLLDGIARADSVVWDLHKMMGLPALNTAVLFRNGRRSYEAFAQEAGYLFDQVDPEAQWFNLGQRTLECTKRGMGLTAYCMLSTLGPAWFGSQVEALIERTEWLQGMLEAAEDFEVFCAAQANILCFRYRPASPAGPAELDALQGEVRRRVVESGAFYLVQTRLRGALWLRVAIMNPQTSRADLAQLLEVLRSGRD